MRRLWIRPAIKKDTAESVKIPARDTISRRTMIRIKIINIIGRNANGHHAALRTRPKPWAIWLATRKKATAGTVNAMAKRAEGCAIEIPVLNKDTITAIMTANGMAHRQVRPIAAK